MMRLSANWKPWLLSLLAGLLSLAAVSVVERLERGQMREHERRHVLNALSQLRAQLEGILSGNLLMVRGLSAVIAANPDLDQTSFARIAEGMVTPQHALRNVAGAPDLVIRLMHPIEGNEAAIGLDYRTHPTQRAAALRAVESRQTVVAGPLELVQGGFGLVAREPVILQTESPDQPAPLWGMVSAVIDVDKLYRLAGVDEFVRSSGLELAIRGRDGKGADGEVFYGDPALFDDDSELIAVSLPGGSWQLAARPGAGWQSHVHAQELFAKRTLGLFVSVLFALLTYAVTRNALALRRTAAELEDSQRLFRGFMDHLPAGAFIKDLHDGKLLFENRWLHRLLPVPRGHCGMHDEADPDALRRGPETLHSELEADDGRRVHCDTLRFLLADGYGRDLVGGVVMDVSEQVRAQLELSTSRARLRALLDTIPDLVWMKDPDGVYLACNSRFEDFFGATEAEIVGKRDHDFVRIELADFFRAHDIAAAAAGRPTMNEEEVTFASDGHKELLETIKSPVYDDAGGLIGVLGVARDITARRAAEQALRANTERLQAAESIAHIGNWEYRVADGHVTWSDETYRILGLAPEEREPAYAWLLSQMHPDDREAHNDYLQSMLDAKPGQSIGEQRFRLQRDDGERLVISVRVSIDFDAEDRPERLFGTIQDITEREAMTQDLREQLNELTRWQTVILGREDRIQELKREVNALLREQGRTARYAAAGEAE